MSELRPPIYGLMAEFDDPERLVEATHRAYAAGYRQMDAYSPYEVEGLGPALGVTRTSVPWIVLLGGIAGGITGYWLQWWVSAQAYPINVGGKPYNAWPMFIPVIFELTVLFASLAALFGMLILNGLPMLYHPVFNVGRFARASRDGFFLVIESADARFEPAGTRTFLESLGPRAVSNVPL